MLSNAWCYVAAIQYVALHWITAGFWLQNDTKKKEKTRRSEEKWSGEKLKNKGQDTLNVQRWVWCSGHDQIILSWMNNL